MPSDPLSPLHQRPEAVASPQERYRYRRQPRRWLGTPIRVVLRWLHDTGRWLLLGPGGEVEVCEKDPRKEDRDDA